MISSVLAVAMAAWMQPADTTRASREAFTGCLRTYVDRAQQNRMTAADFQAAYPQQCTAQQTAYRTAIIARERASRMSQADSEESATMEIDDARTNFAERFEPASGTATAAASPPATAPATTPTATATQAAATTPATTPSATPAATPAAQTTPPR
ncbi:MAG TPA: hypothetical protein VEC11_10185 [Allosphingosinicella sp.]|nr:hypothetical protein [Allosphingosinicella sp.]